MTKLVLEITPNKREPVVCVRIVAGARIAPGCATVAVEYGSVREERRRQTESVTVIELRTLAEKARMTIDFGGPMPSGVLILPEQTTAILQPLPQLVDDASGALATHARIWHRDYPPQRLNSVVSALFAHNTHLTHLDYTFAGLPELKGVPESLFFPLIYTVSFAGVLAQSGIESVGRQLFAANLQAEDFSQAFLRCRSLTKVPEDLFSGAAQARSFNGTFAESGLTDIPARLFANVRRRSSFVGTFARTPIRTVPSGLMHGLDPANVDGMFEPAAGLDHDPIKIKAGPAFPQDFFDDTRNAAGVPTCRLF